MIDDTQIGKNIQALREGLDMTQKQLATAMRRAGKKWSQATVWSVEAGERPIRLDESLILEDILEANHRDIVQSARRGHHARIANKLESARLTLEEDAIAYEEAFSDALRIVDDEDIDPEVRDQLKDLFESESTSSRLNLSIHRRNKIREMDEDRIVKALIAEHVTRDSY